MGLKDDKSPIDNPTLTGITRYFNSSTITGRANVSFRIEYIIQISRLNKAISRRIQSEKVLLNKISHVCICVIRYNSYITSRQFYLLTFFICGKFVKI